MSKMWRRLLHPSLSPIFQTHWMLRTYGRNFNLLDESLTHSSLIKDLSKTWILESFRVTAITYYNHHSRYPRAAAWSKKGRFLRRMVVDFFHGNLPVARLTPDYIEARYEWWISSRAYFDGLIDQAERVPHF
nr:phospholipase-like protein [Tanacetum cinerariifolium]